MVAVFGWLADDAPMAPLLLRGFQYYIYVEATFVCTSHVTIESKDSDIIPGGTGRLTYRRLRILRSRTHHDAHDVHQHQAESANTLDVLLAFSSLRIMHSALA
jgi:hypothetical protein